MNFNFLKKVETPPPPAPPPFQVCSLFLAKTFVPPQVTQFLEGPTHPPLIRGEGGGFQLCDLLKEQLWGLLIVMFDKI